jgi:hypothetical protein
VESIWICDGANNGDDCASGNEMEITRVQADYLTSYATLTLSMPEQSQKEQIYNLLTKMAVEEIEDVGFDASPLNSGEVGCISRTDAWRKRTATTTTATTSRCSIKRRGR